MVNLMEIGNVFLPQNPLVEVKFSDLRIDIEPSPIPLLPVIHIDAQLEIKLGF